MNGDLTDRMMALGYVMGVSDSLDGIIHCSGQNVTNGQTRDVVKAYLEKNPQIRDMAAETLASKALQDAFPCKKGKNL
jgi:ABC-type branched-subunit amino acid transport system ATPase component